MTTGLTSDLFAEDKVWDTLSSALVGKAFKTSGRGFNSFNCPACMEMGQPRPDTRRRCCVIYDAQGIGINCFNCGLKARFQKGSLLSKNMQMFLECLGVPKNKIEELYFWSWQLHRLARDENLEIPKLKTTFFHTGFESVSLPEKSKSIVELAEAGCQDNDFLDTINYLISRGDDLQDATDYYWTPLTKNNMNRRLIVPFYYENHIVGYTGRAIDGTLPKYLNNSPEGYLFNCNVMNKNRKYLIIVEGIFDALGIDGVCLQSNQINDKKINWLNSSKQTKILVPDRDKSGEKLIDVAIKHGWHVSFPCGISHKDQWWDNDIKDVADAVKRYGKLWTLRSIINTATIDFLSIAANRSKTYGGKR